LKKFSSVKEQSFLKKKNLFDENYQTHNEQDEGRNMQICRLNRKNVYSNKRRKKMNKKEDKKKLQVTTS